LKLLFDENLSPALVRLLAEEFPGSAHVHAAGLRSKRDTTVWEYAKLHGLCIVSKDADFQHRSFLLGHPPKVIGIALGNCSAARVALMLRESLLIIARFEADHEASFLILGDREE
jgi:predicted nuclease of predicted toxin-antitoxin system